ncbi:site-specific integrase [Streptomyces avermitilis]|uniref:site-specific integrase n=1 Tax=Streptomyces avermitilis TaxID=33903 RepID=UPI00340A326F
MEQQRQPARALARFFTFLHTARGGKSWRTATEADLLTFHQWRRRDEAGPHVEGTTWNQEVSLVNQFYDWAVRQRYVAAVPIPHRARRPAPMGSVVRAFDSSTVLAIYAHDTTFRRHFPDIAQKIAALRSAPPTPGAPSKPTRYDRRVARNAKLKRHNRELTETLTLAACHIQRITLENQKLREELEAAMGVARLTPIPSRRSATS